MGFLDKIHLPDETPDEADKKVIKPARDTVRVYGPAEVVARFKKQEQITAVYGPAEWFGKNSSPSDVVEVYGPAEMLGAITGEEGISEEDAPLPQEEPEVANIPDDPPPVYGPAEDFEPTPIMPE